MRSLTAILPAVFIIGCVPPTVLTLNVAPADASAAAAMLEAGTGTIHGSGLLRQKGGGVVTCAGNDVFLVPATSSASSEFRRLFGGDQGFVRNGRGSFGGGKLVAAPQPHRTVMCNAQGFFTFSNVRPGKWYVMTAITWVVGDDTQGGTLLSSTDLIEGASVEIVLTVRQS
jgi:hypothetical protein